MLFASKEKWSFVEKMMVFMFQENRNIEIANKKVRFLWLIHFI